MRRMTAYAWTALMVLLLAATMWTGGAARAKAETSGFLPTRMYDGVLYAARPSSETTTILLIGYDHEAQGSTGELHGYSSGGQSDFLLLIQLDHRAETIRMLQINRDTMASVKVTDRTGRQHEPMRLQICLSHAYGNTREKNNANTVWSVERLLGIDSKGDGAQIDWYVSMDISGISRLNDLLGGVTVTVPEDMTSLEPRLVKGATVQLQGREAEWFCRGRAGIGDRTNLSRMERQRTYLEAAGKRLTELIHEDVSFGNYLLESMGLIHDRSVDSDNPFAQTGSGTPAGEAGGKYLMSSESVSGIVNALLKAVDYERLPIETLPGTASVGEDGYMRYELEENAALEWALRAFYRK